jgi:hypothetical protein
MKDRRYSEEEIRDWCGNHFPPIDTSSTNPSLEATLKAMIIEGSTYFDRLPVAANRTLHKLKPKDKYVRYFTNRARIENLGFENFHYLCSKGGSKYTNEYQYATILIALVSDEVAGKSMKLLSQYDIGII